MAAKTDPFGWSLRHTLHHSPFEGVPGLHRIHHVQFMFERHASGKGRERGLRDQEASTELRTGPRFCSKHRRETDVDLVNTRCREPGCGKHPSYGEASSSPDGAGRKTLYPPSPRKSLV